MRPKSLIILLIVCGILSVVAYRFSQRDNLHPPQEQLGLKLFDALPVNQIVGVDIMSPNHRVSLKKGDSVWVVTSRFGYPASFSKLADFITDVSKLKIGTSFEASPETRSRLSLFAPDDDQVAPEQRGTRVVLHGQAAEADLADLIVGQPRSVSAGQGGHYVFLESRSRAYLVDGNFQHLKQMSADWLQTDLTDVESQTIDQITCRWAGSDTILYSLKRPESGGDPEFMDPPEGKTVLKDKIETAFEALDGLQIDDILDPAATSNSSTQNRLHLEYRLKSGLVYDVYPYTSEESEEPRRFYLKIGVRMNPDEISAESDPGATTSPPTESPAARAEQLDRRLTPWTYLVSSWRFERFITAPDLFFETAQTIE